MSDTNPYMIRLELLKLAQNLLEQQTYATQERLRMDWDAAEKKYPYPEMPVVTAEHIVAAAEYLNEFVSRKS